MVLDIVEERVYPVCVGTTEFVYLPVELAAGVIESLTEFVAHGVTVEVYETTVNVADCVREFLDVAVIVLDTTSDLEMMLDLDPIGETVDVFDGGIVLVCVTDAVEVLEGATLLLDVSVFKGFVGEPRGLEEVVLDELILAVLVVEDVVVFVPAIVLETVGDADDVLELLDVTVVVIVLNMVIEPLGLAEPLGDPVDVFEGAIERVIVGDAELVLEGGRDLDIVGEPVLVFEVLTLPVDVFVGGIVLDNLAEDVVVRVAAIV